MPAMGFAYMGAVFSGFGAIATVPSTTNKYRSFCIARTSTGVVVRQSDARAYSVTGLPRSLITLLFAASLLIRNGDASGVVPDCSMADGQNKRVSMMQSRGVSPHS